MSKIKIELSIISDNKLDKELLDNLLDNESDVFYQIGDLTANGVSRNESAWILSTQYVKALEVEPLISSFFNQIGDLKKIGTILKSLNVDVKIDVVIREVGHVFPSLFIPYHLIKKINFLNGDLDIDVLI
nr:DUF4279 domain-containing protein [uncultured Carboxylicivirga sp.]